MCNKKQLLLCVIIIIVIFSGCSSVPSNQPWKADKWNVYGFHDPVQDVRITDFYDNYDSSTGNYKKENLLWYRSVDRGRNSVDKYLESEVVYLGQTQEGIAFCSREDFERLDDADGQSRIVVMNVEDLRMFSQDLDEYTVLRINYRYFYRPVFAPQGKDPASVSNRTISQAQTEGLMGASDFFLDEYEIIGAVEPPEVWYAPVVRVLQRGWDIASALVRGTSRAIGRLLGIDDFISDGVITLENGKTYQRVGLGEVAKKAREYTGPDLLLTSRVYFNGSRGNNDWAFREAEGNLIQTMTYNGHIPSSMKEVRIYYRLRDGGLFEVDEVKQASIFNDQW